MVNIKKDGDQYTSPVIVVTEHHGVIFGYMNPDDISKRSFPMKKTKVAIEWGTTKGINELAATGPTAKSLISAEADAPIVHDVIKVLKVSREAESVWLKS